jgi:hypothetical protein
MDPNMAPSSPWTALHGRYINRGELTPHSGEITPAWLSNAPFINESSI